MQQVTQRLTENFKRVSLEATVLQVAGNVTPKIFDRSTWLPARIFVNIFFIELSYWNNDTV